jgi:hypothetical protein
VVIAIAKQIQMNSTMRAMSRDGVQNLLQVKMLTMEKFKKFIKIMQERVKQVMGLASKLRMRKGTIYRMEESVRMETHLMMIIWILTRKILAIQLSL